ncbi:unnamed protein product [Caenorhabditis sp. 36 PRJEB53466]|nr:unnamed protein product [Caenorhabditis sp. 36 PRJEB53466]
MGYILDERYFGGISGKLPPVVSQESRERAEAVKKAFDRPKTAHRNSRPLTSTYALPSFGNGRLPTASKNIRLNVKRSNSETRPLPKIEYGRSPSREKLADLRDELFQTKKKVADYEINFKKLNTEMQRIKRDAEKRETFLERIVTAQYHPTELNDTNLARTLTSIKRKEMAKENLIDIQYKELERLRNLLKVSDIPTEQKPMSPLALSEVPESASGEESDYPEEPDLMKSNGILKRVKETDQLPKSRSANADEDGDEVFVKPVVKETEKSRERNALAKKYAEQNALLKKRLKEVKENYVAMMEKTKKKGEEFVRQNENSKAVVEKTVAITNALEMLQKEREDLTEEKRKNEEKLMILSQELREAHGEIDALKMENESLQDNIIDLESRVGKLRIEPDYEPNIPINIPRLDMTDIDNTENGTLHESTDRSLSSGVSEFDHSLLAGALAELAGAHCERLKLITQQ